MEDHRLPVNERVEWLKRHYWPYLLLAVYIGSFTGMFFAVLTIDRNLWSAVIWGLAFAAIEVVITLVADRSIRSLSRGEKQDR